MKNSILVAIYHTLGMSAHPQNHQNFDLLGEKMVTKCIMKASHRKSHQKVTNMSKNNLRMQLERLSLMLEEEGSHKIVRIISGR